MCDTTMPRLWRPTDVTTYYIATLTYINFPIRIKSYKFRQILHKPNSYAVINIFFYRFF